MKRILIIGAGVLGQQYSHWITNYSADKVVGWLDDSVAEDKHIFGNKVLGPVSSIDDWTNHFDEVAIAIGYTILDYKLQLLHYLLEKQITLYTYFHPSAYIDVSAHVEQGVFVYPHCVVDQRVILESGVRLGNNVVISHDSRIGSCCFFSPSVTTSGSVSFGKCCFVGTGTVLKNGISITANTTIGAGSLILKSIDEPGTYVGGPLLRKLK